MKASAPVAVIGDIVRSRDSLDRQRLHDRLARVLAETNEEVPAQDPLAITLGDDFQGVFTTLGSALAATFRVRTALHPVEVRFGIGRGGVHTLDARRGIHDGPAFWAARDGIEAAAALARQAQTRTTRTVYLSPDDDPADVAAVRASLMCLDFMVGSLSTTSHAVLKGLMQARTQHDIAERVGISPSAVSQRVRRDGIGVILEAMTALAGLP